MIDGTLTWADIVKYAHKHPLETTGHGRRENVLNYFALGLLFFVVITLFYAVIAIYDVPYEIAAGASIRIRTPSTRRDG